MRCYRGYDDLLKVIGGYDMLLKVMIGFSRLYDAIMIT